MTVVAEERRSEALQSLGLSAPVRSLALGETPQSVFWFRCNTPYMVYHGANVPVGPELVPIWECRETVTAGWLRDGEAEFIEFSVEKPAEYHLIAVSEQGLLAHLFSSLIEDEDWHDERNCLRTLREGAVAVGFQHLDEMLQFQQLHGHQPNYPELLERRTTDIRS